ncbi:hypothetical protein JK386_16570 [Nocardioides sp. zg-536]|uniref:Uncharacterized protein n=1 Tax=Nocardioides faecalis TaxID=2803858 RepID=A0A938YBX8_9ACTN|nr:hypothetical protein [Nocardioides faecalis]MBM9461520.1 hypothetical protein [Nocardioides faecalis]MBS4752570.1 hypothetical protein [Nocardioides faecalis]QVI57851.1 hypothetical protein KG111_12395 [Nocardioides faecalis]
MSRTRTYEYARLWVPLYDAAAQAVTRPVYLIEAADGFEGVAAEKNTTLMGLFSELGGEGWRIEPTAMRVDTPDPAIQLLIDATLDEADHATAPEQLASAVGSGGDPAGTVAQFDVYNMRRRGRA